MRHSEVGTPSTSAKVNPRSSPVRELADAAERAVASALRQNGTAAAYMFTRTKSRAVTAFRRERTRCEEASAITHGA